MTNTDFTISDVFPVAEFARWAASKPADERYDYTASCGCAVAQFLRATGRSGHPAVGGFTWADPATGRSHRLPDGVADAAVAFGIEDKAVAWTFGALATRLEALEPKSAWTRSDAYLNDLELARA